MKLTLPGNYHGLIEELKDKIRQTRLKASQLLNRQMLLVFWEVGRTICTLELEEGWGSGIVDKMARDLRMAFPDMEGWSPRSLRYMKTFYSAYPEFPILTAPTSILQRPAAKSSKKKADVDSPILQPPAAKIPSLELAQIIASQIPWTYHQVLFDKVKDLSERIFYMQKIIQNDWSRDILKLQIENNLYERQGKSINNFQTRLPHTQSDLARATFKNPYLLGFLNLTEEAKEREVEQAIIQHLKKFLLELDRGFSYVGNQFNLKVDGDEFFLDLLFFNYLLNCFVIFEIKIGDFKPEYAGKLNFYVTTVDKKIKQKQHKRTIGVLLCKTPNETIIRFALERIGSPIGVAQFRLAKAIPKEIKNGMPTVKELENELTQEMDRLKSPSDSRWDGIKMKLANLNKGEIKKIATPEILFDLFDSSIKPLYKNLLSRLMEFEPEFISSNYSWNTDNKNISSLSELESFWKSEDFLRHTQDLHFCYRFNGLKKAGIDGRDIMETLVFTMSQYYYGFKLINHNHQEPCKKMLYGESLKKTDIDEITELVLEKVMDRIEFLLSNLMDK